MGQYSRRCKIISPCYEKNLKPLSKLLCVKKVFITSRAAKVKMSFKLVLKLTAMHNLRFLNICDTFDILNQDSRIHFVTRDLCC